ncbi:PucR family transcriptional regulator [Saccharopolyspora sp. 5N102]|uniref:PucR family transcriptional regulator n=1 Tax=Saccharopolyspora sp. 5N102 TaxID=3375155 RepID=UPI0037A87CC5
MIEPGDADRTGPVAAGLTVRDVLGMELLADAEVLAGAGGLDRQIQRLNVMTVPNILPWTKEHEFMLSTGYPLPQSEEELAELVRQFAHRGVAVFGIKFGRYARALPQRALDTADELALPIVRIPEDVAFDDILSRVFSDIVNRQAATIARAQEIHSSFLHIVLAGGQLPEIAAKLSELLGGVAVFVADEDGRTRASVYNAEQRDRLVDVGVLDGRGRLRTAHLGPGAQQLAEDLTVIIAPVSAGELRCGRLVVVGPSDQMGPEVTVAVDQAAVVAALDVTRQLAVDAVERQFAANVLHDLVTGQGADIDDALAQCATFGWDLHRRLVVVVSRAEWVPSRERAGHTDPDLAQQRYLDLWCSEVRNQDPRGASAGFATNLVAVVGAAEDDPAAVPREMWSGLKATTRHEFSMGVSSPVDDPRLISVGYEQARKALHMGRRARGPGKVTSFADLGLFRLLSLVADVGELRRFVDDTLGPLLGLEERERAELLKTLDVLLSSHLNVAVASRALHVHYNTMRHRIAKLEQLVGPFMLDSRLCLHLSVALQVLEMPDVAR